VNSNLQYVYSVKTDTLSITIFPLIDNLNVKNDKVIFFDYICTKSKKQIINIPVNYFKNIRFLIFESKYMKTYFFIKKRKHKNYFVLKCVC